MNDALRRYLEAASGFGSLTVSKAERLAKQLVRSGEAASDQVGELVEQLIERQRRNRDSVTKLVRSETTRAVRAMGLATRGDLEQLQQEVAGLTRRIEELDRQAPAPQTPGPRKTARKTTAKKTAKKTAAATTTAKKTRKKTAKTTAKKTAKTTAKKTAKTTAKKTAKTTAKRTAKQTTTPTSTRKTAGGARPAVSEPSRGAPERASQDDA